MICSEEIRLANFNDAACIAEMSRNFIESGLGWSWTPMRVVREINAKSSNVIVVVEGHEIIGIIKIDDYCRLLIRKA